MVGSLWQRYLKRMFGFRMVWLSILVTIQLLIISLYPSPSFRFLKFEENKANWKKLKISTFGEKEKINSAKLNDRGENRTSDLELILQWAKETKKSIEMLNLTTKENFSTAKQMALRYFFAPKLSLERKLDL